LQQQFVDGLSELTARADAAGDTLDRPLRPAIEFPPLAHHPKRDVLAHVATHNAHHLAQVILLRQCSAPGHRRPAAGLGEPRSIARLFARGPEDQEEFFAKRLLNSRPSCLFVITGLRPAVSV
jgi:hypothetical protein